MAVPGLHCRYVGSPERQDTAGRVIRTGERVLGFAVRVLDQGIGRSIVVIGNLMFGLARYTVIVYEDDVTVIEPLDARIHGCRVLDAVNDFRTVVVDGIGRVAGVLAEHHVGLHVRAGYRQEIHVVITRTRKVEHGPEIFHPGDCTGHVAALGNDGELELLHSVDIAVSVVDVVAEHLQQRDHVRFALQELRNVGDKVAVSELAPVIVNW